MKRRSVRLIERSNQQVGDRIPLPNEIMVFIFEQLDLNSLLKCRLVSKEWNELAKVSKIKKLSVMIDDGSHEVEFGYRFYSFYEFTYDQINRCTLFKTKNLHFMQSTFIKDALSRVRKLSIDYVLESVLFTLASCELQNLEQLQIFRLNSSEIRTLTLPSLKIFSVYDFNGPKLILKAPNLVKLRWSPEFHRLELDQPQNITHLFALEIHLPKEKTPFLNVSHMYLINSDRLRLLDITNNYTNLKELNFSRLVLRDEISAYFDTAKPSLNNPNLQITFSDFRISTLNDVDDLFDTPHFTRYAHHYDKLANVVRFTDVLYYNEMVKILNKPLADLTKRFVAVSQVFVNDRVANPNDLAEFLKKMSDLICLVIRGSSLTQAFYDNLNLFVPRLIMLIIEEDRNVIDSVFISKLDNLRHYDINQPVSIDVIKSKFKNSDSFKRIEFMLKGRKLDFNFNVNGELSIDGFDSNAMSKDRFLKYVKNIFNLSSPVDVD